MPKEILTETSDAVLREYAQFTAPTEEGRQQLAKIRENVKGWFNSPSRIVTNAAAFSFEKLVEAEVDHVTPGDRGPGRVVFLPRLAARHRSAVARMNQNAQDKLRLLIGTHLLCGYLFADFANQMNRDVDPQLLPEKLYEMWIDALYPPFINLDPRNKTEEDIKGIWFGSTGRTIRDHLQSHGADWQDLDMQILTHYFNGGMLLRMLESCPLTDEELANIRMRGSTSKKTTPVGWPTLSEEELSVFSLEERAILEHEQLELIEGNKKQLEEINASCRIRPQYAKTYRVLRRGKRETLEEMRANLDKSNPGTSDAFNQAMIRSFDRIILYKHSQMALFFKATWGEDIENWSGKEGIFFDRAGCAILLSSVAAVILIGYLFLF
jgi:hypothetical protein